MQQYAQTISWFQTLLFTGNKLDFYSAAPFNYFNNLIPRHFILLLQRALLILQKVFLNSKGKKENEKSIDTDLDMFVL